MKIADCVVIIPTMDEEKTIGAVLGQLDAGKDAIVVDGGSKDATVRIAAGLGATVIKERKKGNGAAFKAGVRATSSEYLAMIDGDGTYPAAGMAACLRKIRGSGADALFGDRLSKKGNEIRAARHIGNILMTFFINALFGTRLADSQSGFCILRRDALERNMPKSDGMSHCQEIKIRLCMSGARCMNVPIEYHDRQTGSKFRFFRDGIALGLDALRLRLGLI